jgi:hypothetical protein
MDVRERLLFHDNLFMTGAGSMPSPPAFFPVPVIESILFKHRSKRCVQALFVLLLDRPRLQSWHSGAIKNAGFSIERTLAIDAIG